MSRIIGVILLTFLKIYQIASWVAILMFLALIALSGGNMPPGTQLNVTGLAIFGFGVFLIGIEWFIMLGYS